MAAAAELALLERSLGLSKGNKYSAQGERQIPVLQTNNGPSLTGLTTIAAHLVKQANKEYLLGSTAEEKAIVQQWLEYRVTRVDGNSSKDDIRILLKDLNSYLEDKVYLTGYNFTLADILLYYGLHRFIAHASHAVGKRNTLNRRGLVWNFFASRVNKVKFPKCKILIIPAAELFNYESRCFPGHLIFNQVDLTVQEKEKYLNVSRWFCHIQHYPGIRQHLSSVVFIKNRLYTNSH